jgi:hypothetical protein
VASPKEYKGSKKTTVSYSICSKDIACVSRNLSLNKLKPIVEALIVHWCQTQCAAEYGDEAEAAEYGDEASL